MIVAIYSTVMPSAGTPAAFSFSAVTSGTISYKMKRKIILIYKYRNTFKLWELEKAWETKFKVEFAQKRTVWFKISQ